MMVNQEHSGQGDNVAGGKFEFIVRSIQSRDLRSVIDNIMHDIRHRNLSVANEKLGCLDKISALEPEVCLLLQALRVKLELVRGSVPSSKNDLLTLLSYQNLTSDVREVVTSILIDFESRNSEETAKRRYLDSTADSFYIKEVFFERLASEEELWENYKSPTAYNLSEQEVTGLVRGGLRVKNCAFAFELARHLDDNFPSNNSRVLLLHTETRLLVSRNQNRHYFSLGKQEKANMDRLIVQLVADIDDKYDDRHIPILTNLLQLTYFLDRRLFDLGQIHIDSIKKVPLLPSEFIEVLSTGMKTPQAKFELVSDSLDSEQFAHLNFALARNQIKVREVKEWVDNGGVVNIGDEYLNSFVDLYLRALVCSVDDKEKVLELDKRAQSLLSKYIKVFYRINPNLILRLCERFIYLSLPLNAVNYLSPFLPDKAWVSPIFECYLNALFQSEKFDLFLSKVNHLEPEDKTELVYLIEAQVYERTNKYDLSIRSIRYAIGFEPNNPYTWHLLLHVSRSKGLSVDDLKEIIFEIPDAVFSTYDESKVALINEIAIYVDINLADRVLVDWFVQNPAKVAKPLIQIHTNSLINRPEVNRNPYLPINCGDGVTYSDGFETFTRILTRDVEASHPILLDIDSPLGKILENMQEGERSGEITMLERLPPYVAAFRLAAELRSKGNDGTDAFRQFSLPANEEEFIPYFEKILRHYSSKEKKRDAVLESPNIPLVMRGKFTDPGDPVRAAVIHLTSSASTQYMDLFNRGEDAPSKVIIDIYTAVYFSLMGFASAVVGLNVELIVCQYTKKVLEEWIENILRDDYMSMGVSDEGLYRITSKDIQRDSLGLIQGLQTLLEYAKLEALKPVDTPELLVRIRDMVDATVYSTVQLSVANGIPLLSIDHLMCELACHSGCPTANMNSVVMKILDSLSLSERKKSIQLNLISGTPAPILYGDILELSRSYESSDTYLVFKFIEKYGETIDKTGSALSFLTEVVRNVTVVAYIDGAILAGGRAYNPQYDGYVEHVFNYCCRCAMVTLEGETAEQRFGILIYNVIDMPRRVRKYVELISLLASTFAVGHFLDVDACNESLAVCHEARKLKEQGDIEEN